MTRKGLRRFLFTLTLLSGRAFVFGDTGFDPSEAPTSLFQDQIGDAGVSLEAEGTWTTRFATGWGQASTPQGTLPGLTYPGYERAPVFQQIPDFSLTLWLLDRYYLELNYRIKNQSMLLGYKGKPGEFVQWVKAGNAPFTAPPRAGDSLPLGRPGAPAVGAGFTTGDVDFDAVVRYEDGTRETKTYLGYRDTSTSTVEADAWIQGRFFQLPSSSAPFTGIQVLVEDPAGALNGFRKALAGEVSINPSTGEVWLSEPAAKRFLITWDGAAAWSAGLGSTYTSPKLGIKPVPNTSQSSGTWYVLIQPGSPSAFELRNRYPVPTGVTGAILMYDKGSGHPISTVSVSQASSQPWFVVSGPAEAPFFDTQVDGYYAFQGMYPNTTAGAAPPPTTASLPWVFRLPMTTTATSYSLGTDVIASSIIVTRNGLAVSGYKFDPQTGILTFDVPVFDTDSVTISFQRTLPTAPATNLVTWQGGKWTPSDNQNVEWNFQSRWNMAKDTQTTEDLQSPGRVATTVQWKGADGPWGWTVKATGGAVLSDSTGKREIYGQNATGAQAYLDGNALRPSAAPGVLSMTPYPSGSTYNTINMTESNRVQSYFSNYWTVDSVTGSLYPGAYGTPGVSRKASGAGGWIGPYVVRGDGSKTDRMAVIDADFDAVNEWSAMEVFLNSGKTQDLTNTSAITVPIRLAVNAGSGTQVYLQAGTLSENFDGTGAVRGVQYSSIPYINFFNQNPSVAAGQQFAIPDGATWGNDGLGTGTTIPDGTLVNKDLTSSLNFSDNGWQSVRVQLSAAERALLKQATGWRLIVANPSGTAGNRVVLVGPVVFEGSTWSVIPQSTGKVVASDQADPTRSDGRQLRIDWSGQTTGAPGWLVQGRQNPVRPAAYGTIAFQYQWLQSNAATVTFKMTDANGRGLTASWPVTGMTNGWVKGRINLQQQTITFNGQEVNGATVTMSPGAKATTWDRMFISSLGCDTGGMLISEINALDPQWEAIGSTDITTTWKQQEPWPSRETPIFSGMNVTTQSFQEGLNDYNFTWLGKSTVAGTVGIVQETAEASFATTPTGQKTHGAYETTLPLKWPGGQGPGLTWTEKFSDAGLRSERAVLDIPWVGSWDALVKASGPPLTLDQDYRFGWTAPPQLPDGWGANLSAEWNQTRAFIGTVGDFGNQWTESWKWLTPPGATAPFYLLQTQGSAQAPITTNVSADATASAQVSQAVGPVNAFSPTGTWQWRFPVRLDAIPNWTITPLVSKKSDAVFDIPSPLDPGTGAQQAGSWILSQPSGLFALPYAELNSPVSIWQGAPSGLQSGTVQSTSGFDWERQKADDWTDLAFPLNGGMTVTGTQGREGIGDYQSNTVATHLETRALNLFGTLGSQPVFTWYRTDVWSWTLANSWTNGTRVQDQITTAAITARSELVLSQRESVALPISFQGTWGVSPLQSLTLKPSWTLKDPASFPFDLPRWLSPSSFRKMWVQDLSAALNMVWQPTPAPVVRDLEIIWKGRFLLSEKSELDFTTKWGQQWMTNLYVTGFEAAMDFILSF